MPLGGYCEKCERWVWLNSYGECEAGHKARFVRQVQQLKPRERGELVAVSPQTDLAPQRTTRWRFPWRHSLWVGWTLTFGVANWVAFLYVGTRARRLLWTFMGFVYLVPFVLTLVSIGLIGSPGWEAFLVLQLFVSAASFVHALYLRPYYRAIMFGDMPGRRLPAPPQPPPLLTGNDRLELPRGTDERAAEVIGAAHAQVDDILDLASGIGRREVRDEVVRLCRTAEQILAELSRKPARVDTARHFLTYYLDAAQRIVSGYAELAGRGVASGDAAQTLARAERSLASVQQAFDRELEVVTQDQLIDLDAEIELLEKTVRTENLYKQTGGQ
jgi:hypothetical protein